MAGATNRALKAAGVPKATIATLRVEQGGHLSLRSAISIAHERGLDTGKAHEFMAKRDAKKAAAPASQAATADFRSKAAATMKAAGERTAKEGRAAVLAARLRDRAANALGTNRGDIANARADRILKANPGARGLAEQLRGERRFETKSAVNQTMRLGQVSRSNFNLPATRSERVAGLLSSMKAKEAQSAARRADMKKAQQAAAPTDAKKRRSATDFYAPPSRGPSKREKQAIRDARDVILGPRKAAAATKFKGAGPFNADRHKARAMALSDARKAQFAAASARLQAAKTPEERATASKAMAKAQDAVDRAGALNRGASAMVGARDRAALVAKARNAAKAKARAALPAVTAQIGKTIAVGRAAMSAAPAPKKGTENILRTDNGAPFVQGVKPLHQKGDFFVHKGIGGGYSVTHRTTGLSVGSSNYLSTARGMMEGLSKTGSKVLSRIQSGDTKAAAAFQRYTNMTRKARYGTAAATKYYDGK